MPETQAGRIAVVTGAGQGLGRAIAGGLAGDVAGLLLADILEEPLREAATQLANTATTAAAIDTHPGDLSTPAGAENMTESALSRFGRVDILVNNAGGGVLRPFLEHDEESVALTLSRNLLTTFHCCRSILPHMLERSEHGRIINIGADSVRNGLWMHAMYNAAKGGVHGLTTGLAREFAHQGITVNTVAPSIVATDDVRRFSANPQHLSPDWRRLLDEAIGAIPTGRPAESEEIAATVRFLASPAASFLTGQVLSVNGGSTML
jgi:2,3-dihydroxy-2,3-dihydro-p-cumate dehydrogenase